MVTIQHRIIYNKKEKIGESNSSVYKGKLDGYRDVAVKTMACSEETGEDALTKMNHPNVVELIFVEQQGPVRCYAFEVCAASMNQLFLPEGHEKKYERPSNMPSPKEVLLQLTEGLMHIHSQNIAHRDIKPANILISAPVGGKVIMKWADFDRSKPVNEAGEFSLSVTEVGTPCWIAPEILNKSRGDSTANSLMISFKSDIWSAGCVFFYYLTSGKHPFGDLKNVRIIQNNADLDNPIDIREYYHKPEFASFRNLVRDMVEKSPEERVTLEDVIKDLNGQTRAKSRLIIHEDLLTPAGLPPVIPAKEVNPRIMHEDCFPGQMEISKGGFGAYQVAVKKVHTSIRKYVSEPGEASFILLDHANIVKLLHSETDSRREIKYLALELCAGSIDQYFLESSDDVTGLVLPPTGQVLTSLIKGLIYIHSNGLIYGKIKPQNVLISTRTQPAILQWADGGAYIQNWTEN